MIYALAVLTGLAVVMMMNAGDSLSIDIWWLVVGAVLFLLFSAVFAALIIKKVASAGGHIGGDGNTTTPTTQRGPSWLRTKVGVCWGFVVKWWIWVALTLAASLALYGGWEVIKGASELSVGGQAAVALTIAIPFFLLSSIASGVIRSKGIGGDVGERTLYALRVVTTVAILPACMIYTVRIGQGYDFALALGAFLHGGGTNSDMLGVLAFAAVATWASAWVKPSTRYWVLLSVYELVIEVILVLFFQYTELAKAAEEQPLVAGVFGAVLIGAALIYVAINKKEKVATSPAAATANNHRRPSGRFTSWQITLALICFGLAALTVAGVEGSWVTAAALLIALAGVGMLIFPFTGMLLLFAGVALVVLAVPFAPDLNHRSFRNPFHATSWLKGFEKLKHEVGLR